MVVVNIVLLICTILLLNYLLKCYQYRRIIGKIPGPPGHWLMGNMDFLIKNPSPEAVFNLLRDCAKKYWPIYKFAIPYIIAIGILHPADFEIILSQTKHLSKSRIYTFLESWLGEGLLTSKGVKWQTRRKLLTQAFHFNVLQQFLNVFNEETENLVKTIASVQRKTQNSINIIPLITHMTLQSMAETSMGISNIEEQVLETYRNNIYKMGHLLLKRIVKPWRQLPFVYYWMTDGKEEKATIRTLHEFTYKVIRQREKQLLNEDHENLVSTTYSGRKIMKMLDLLLYEKINNNTIDYEGIREEVDTFMFEGHDTTAAAVTFLLYNLSKYPNIQQKVREEVKDVIGPNKTATFQDLQNLPYTERVIKESLRLHPSVPFISRLTSEDFISHAGYLIPKGSIVQMHIFDLHRDPRIYPDPLHFDPDRFLLENCNDRHPFAYLPFSAGPRNCIGQKFAMMEIKAVAAGILRSFRLEEDPTMKIDFISDLVLRNSGDIRIKFVPIS